MFFVASFGHKKERDKITFFLALCMGRCRNFFKLIILDKIINLLYI